MIKLLFSLLILMFTVPSESNGMGEFFFFFPQSSFDLKAECLYILQQEKNCPLPEKYSL